MKRTVGALKVIQIHIRGIALMHLNQWISLRRSKKKKKEKGIVLKWKRNTAPKVKQVLKIFISYTELEF